MATVALLARESNGVELAEDEEQGRSDSPIKLALYNMRWFVLFAFFGLNAVNAMANVAFAGVPTVAKDDFTSLTDIDLMLLVNWWNVLPIICTFPAMMLLTQDGGLRTLLRLSGLLTFVGCTVRLVPLWDPNFEGSFERVWLHLGQIMNGVAAALLMSSPSKLSAAWFPLHHRATATGIAAMGAAVGMVVSFFVESVYVNDNYHLNVLLWWEAALAAVFFLLMWFVPDHPQSPPSVTAVHPALAFVRPATEGEAPHESSASDQQLPSGLVFEVKTALANRHFMVMVVLMGAVTGAVGGLISVLPSVFTDYSEDFADDVVCVASIASMLSMMCIGPIADYFLIRSYKSALLVLAVSLAVVELLIVISTFGATNANFLSNSWVLCVWFGLGGLCMGAMSVLTYELGAEMTFPLSEGTSGGLFMTVNNFSSMLIVIFAYRLTSREAVMVLFLITVVAAPALSFVKTNYARLDYGENLSAHQRGK